VHHIPANSFNPVTVLVRAWELQGSCGVHHIPANSFNPVTVLVRAWELQGLWGAPHSCKQFQPCHSSGESLGVTRFLWGAPHSCKQFQPCHSSGESLGVTRFLWGAPLTSLANWFLTWEPGYPPHLGVDLYLVLNLAATPCRVEDLGDRWEVPPKALSRKVEISTVETAEHKYLLRTPKSSAGLQRGTSRIEPGMPHAIASHVDQKWGFQT